MENRNTAIRKAFEVGKRPLLSFELVSARKALAAYVARQQELGTIMSDAMSESAETFHDNAPAEAIADASKVNTAQAIHTKKLIADSVEYLPPTEHELGVVTLGSRVSLRFGSSSTSDEFLLTGLTSDFSDEVRTELAIEPTVEAVTLNSPLGLAIFDKSVGDTVSYTAGTRTILVTITAIS